MKKMVSPDEALDLVLQNARRLFPQRLPLARVAGLMLAEDIPADRDYPPFDRAMMDGYACRVEDAGRKVRLTSEAAAGMVTEAPVESGTAVAIMTGAPCPAGAGAVAPVEDAVRDGVWVTLPGTLSGGMHIAPAGCECNQGRVVARAGSPITPLVVANLAALGFTRVLAAPRPRCCVLTTGPEITTADGPPCPGQIRDSNGPMLRALLHEQGVDRVRRLHADDKPEALHRALDQAADDDLVLITGGVSAGKYDLVPRVLAERGVSLVFHKVRQRPGKPLLFGRLGHALYFGLPGNPLASHLGFHRYVAPAIARMAGMPVHPRPETGRLMESLRADAARTAFQVCRVARADDGWRVYPLMGKGSADIFSACTANALVRVEPGRESIAQDTEVAFTWLDIRGPAVTGDDSAA